MGLRSSRSRDRSDDAEDGAAASASSAEQTPASSRAGAARHYGLEPETERELHQLQRLEERVGVQRIRQWSSEGVPIEAMETPQTVAAFRKREGTPVPWDVERRNEQSVQRSTEAAADTSPAGDTGVPDTVREVIASQGRSLDPSIQRAMEDRMGDSFGDVRIHTGPKAAQACDSIDARAFTVGNHVAFNQGEYDPESPEGQHVIAHELAHVRQQTQGAVSMLPQEDVKLEIDPDPALEREAEETAQRVMAGGELGVQRLQDTEVHVQRLTLDEDRTVPYLHYATRKLSEEAIQQLSQQAKRYDSGTLRLEGHDAVEPPDLVGENPKYEWGYFWAAVASRMQAELKDIEAEIDHAKQKAAGHREEKERLEEQSKGAGELTEQHLKNEKIAKSGLVRKELQIQTLRDQQDTLKKGIAKCLETIPYDTSDQEYVRSPEEAAEEFMFSTKGASSSVSTIASLLGIPGIGPAISVSEGWNTVKKSTKGRSWDDEFRFDE